MRKVRSRQTARRRRARSPEAKQELRRRILHEALGLFVEEGYSGFSMRKLARRLRYSAPTLYAYFANKDDLLMAIVGEGYELFRSYVTRAGDGRIDRIEMLGKAYMDFAFGNPMLYKLMFIHRPGDLFDLSEQVVQERLGILTTVVRNLRDTPLLSRLDDAAAEQAVSLFWALVHGLVSLAFTIPLFDQAWARRNLAFFLDRLRPLLTRLEPSTAQLSA